MRHSPQYVLNEILTRPASLSLRNDLFAWAPYESACADLMQLCVTWNGGAGLGVCLWDLNCCEVYSCICFWMTELRVTFSPWCGPIGARCGFYLTPPHAFSVNVVGYACDLGASELSTLTSKQTACLGFARKSCLLTEQSALGFPGRLGGVTAHRGKEDIFVSSLLWRQSLILELNPLILPGNHVQGFYQCTWQIQRHPLSTLSRASYNWG